MKVFAGLKERISRTRYGKMFLEQYGFKTLVFAVFSLVISVAFAVFNVAVAVLQSSVWYGALAAYYITLVIFRSCVIMTDRKCARRIDEKGKLLTVQLKIHLASGCFLVVTEIAMAVAVTQMVLFAPPVVSGQITAIANAAYAFIKITAAVINFVKAKKFADPVSQALRCINLADASMSMASLTVVLLATFGGDSGPDFLLTMKAVVGFAACALVMAIATYMIISSVKKLRSKNNG